MDKKNQDMIKMTVSFTPRTLLEKVNQLIFGKFGEGTSKSTSSALSRPYNQLNKYGKPIGKINYIFFTGNELPSRVLGSLTYTPGGRILFFPGVYGRNVSYFYSENMENKSQTFKKLIDHITLESNFSKWHVTFLDTNDIKEKRLPSFNTKKIDENTYFWFGLSISNPTQLEITPEELVLYFPSSPNDSDRRLKELMQARDKAVFHITHLNSNDTEITDRDFIHFDFFLGPNELEIEKLGCYVPTKEPIVSDFKINKYNIRGHSVTLEGVTNKIWVIVSKHTGKLVDTSIITCL